MIAAAGSITPCGLEAGRSKGVLRFDGIKVHRMADPSGLLFSYLPYRTAADEGKRF